MDVLFLDANVLFSAAYSPASPLLRLWSLPDAALVTSGYAVEEARRNLSDGERRARLGALIHSVRVIPEAPAPEIPRDVDLPEKDRPILAAAIAAGATHLLTGDRRHFGPLYGRSVSGTRVLPPGEYLAGHRAH